MSGWWLWSRRGWIPTILSIWPAEPKKRKSGIGFVNLTLPIPGFASVVGLAAGGLPGHRVQAAPGIPLCGIQLPFLLFGELFVGNHGIILLDFRVL